MTNKEAIQKASWAYIAGAGKAGKGYAIKPSDGSGDFTFSRPDGVNQTGVKNAIDPSGRLVSYPANVPAVNYQLNPNLLLHTEAFDNVYWEKQGATTVTPNAEIAPDGTMTADVITGASNNIIDGNILRSIDVAVSTGVIYTASVYVKLLTATTMSFGVFDTVLGSVQSVQHTATGWSRVTFSYTFSAGGTRITFGNANGTFAIWGAQLVEGTEPLPYNRNDSTRRFIPQGLWIEPSATNLLQRSEEFANATWNNFNNGINLTANAFASPSDQVNATKIVANSNGLVHQISQQFNTIANGNYTISVFARRAEFRYLQLADPSYTGISTVVDLQDGVILSTSQGNANNLTTNVSRLERLRDGWFCISINFKAAGVASPGIGIRMIDNTNSNSFIGDNVSGVYIYAAMVNNDSVLSSYIKTEATPVTRPADVVTITDASDLIGQEQGTILVEVDVRTITPQVPKCIFSFRDSSISRVLLVETDGRLVFRNIDYQLPSAGKYKIGVTYTGAFENLKLFVNGALVVSGTISGTGMNTILGIGHRVVDNDLFFNDFISQAIIFKQALTDDEVRTWTQL